MSHPQLVEKLKKVIDNYDEESQEAIHGWLRMYEKAEIIAPLLKNAAVQELLAGFRTQIATMEVSLKERDKEGDPYKAWRARNAVHDKIELYQSFLSLFEVDERMKGVEEKINNL